MVEPRAEDEDDEDDVFDRKRDDDVLVSDSSRKVCRSQYYSIFLSC